MFRIMPDILAYFFSDVRSPACPAAILAEPHPNLKSETLETFHVNLGLFGPVLHAAFAELFAKTTQEGALEPGKGIPLPLRCVSGVEG